MSFRFITNEQTMFEKIAYKSVLTWLCLVMLIPNSLEIIKTCSFFNYEEGRKFSTSHFKLLYNIGPNACYRECRKHGNCFSVNYNKKFFTCEFLPLAQSLSSLELKEDKDFIYMESSRYRDRYKKKCGEVSCNYYSTCISTLNNNVCIATDCADREPVLKNGKVTDRVYSPHSATYGCQRGFHAVGSVRKIHCFPGGQWESLSYKCMTPINGGFSEWESWTSCTKSCDTGSQTRSRKCNNPAPKYGGANCKGNSTETEDCNNQECPGAEQTRNSDNIRGGIRCYGRVSIHCRPVTSAMYIL